jgi:hypothetical protein
MEEKKRIEAALRKKKKKNEEELRIAIKNMKPINISIMVNQIDVDAEREKIYETKTLPHDNRGNDL